MKPLEPEARAAFGWSDVSVRELAAEIRRAARGRYRNGNGGNGGSGVFYGVYGYPVAVGGGNDGSGSYYEKQVPQFTVGGGGGAAGGSANTIATGHGDEKPPPITTWLGKRVPESVYQAAVAKAAAGFPRTEGEMIERGERYLRWREEQRTKLRERDEEERIKRLVRVAIVIAVLGVGVPLAIAAVALCWHIAVDTVLG